MFARDPNLPRPPTPASRSQATSDVLREPDWGVNVDMCDLVNSNFHRYGKDTVKALRLKLQKKTKPQTQYLALVALEMCMKNCGVMFHAKVIEKACLDETSKCGAARGGDARVKQKALALVQEWALQLQLPQYRAAFDELRRKGERFPPTELTSAEVTPMYTPRPNRTDIVEQRLAQMDPADAAAVRAAVAEAEAEVEAEERRMGTRSPRVSNGFATSPGGGSTPVGSPPGPRGFRVGSPPGSSARPAAPPRGYEALDEDEPFHGTAERNGTAERTYSDGNPYGTAGGGHTSNPTPRSHHAHYPVSHRPELQPPAADASALGDVTSPDAVKKLHDDLDVASNTVKVLRDMLGEVDVVTSPEALNDPTIDELSEQCAQMRPRVVSLVQSVADESLLMKALSLNDELSEVAQKRDALRAAASADRDTRAAIVASMREEEAAAQRHASAGDASGGAPVGDLVDLLGGVSVDPGTDARPGKDKAAPGRAAAADPFGPAAADAPVDPFDVSVTVGDGGNNRGRPGASNPLDELLAPPPPPPQVYDPFAASAGVGPASTPPAGGSHQPANYYPTVGAGTARGGGAVSDPFASANPFASRPPGASPMGAMSVNPLFQAQQQPQQPASSGGMGSLPPAVGASQAPYDPFAASPPPQQRGGSNPFAR